MCLPRHYYDLTEEKISWSGFEEIVVPTKHLLPVNSLGILSFSYHYYVFINGALYMLGGNVCNSIRCFYRRIFLPALECLLSRLVSSCIVEKGYVLPNT